MKTVRKFAIVPLLGAIGILLVFATESLAGIAIPRNILDSAIKEGHSVPAHTKPTAPGQPAQSTNGLAAQSVIIYPPGTNALAATNMMLVPPITNAQPITNVVLITAAARAKPSTNVVNNTISAGLVVSNTLILPPMTNSASISNIVVIPPMTNATTLTYAIVIPAQSNATWITNTSFIAPAGAVSIPPVEVVSGQFSNLTASIQIYADKMTESEFGPTFAKAFYVAEVTVQNPYSNSILVYSSSLKVGVRYIVKNKQLRKLDKSSQTALQGAYVPGVRRPATFSDILAIFDYQQEKNWKQRTVDVLKSAGQIAAGATVFIGGATYPKAVSLATGIITPEIEKHLLWDLLLHAKNLDARSFKEIEEVPPYKPITKLVFFPKGGIPGILPEMPVYLSYFPPSQDIEVSGTELINQKGIQTGPLQPETKE